MQIYPAATQRWVWFQKVSRYLVLAYFDRSLQILWDLYTFQQILAALCRSYDFLADLLRSQQILSDLHRYWHIQIFPLIFSLDLFNLSQAAILNQTITNPTWPDEEDGSLKVYLFMYVHMFMDHIAAALTYHYYKYSQFSLLLDLVLFRPCF